MHRSGTSALARVINLLGAALPERLIGAGVGNPTGHWEPEDANRIHEAAFASLGSSYDDPRPMPTAWFDQASAKHVENEISAFLDRELVNTSPLIVKDPRLSLFAPLWFRVLARRGVNVKTVMIVRHPLEVAGSLTARDGWTKPKGLMLWLKYVLDGERHARVQPRTILTHDELMSNWRSTVDRLIAELDVAELRRSPSSDEAIDTFLDPNLTHHLRSLDELDADEDVGSWIRDSYVALLGLRSGDASATDTLDRVHREWIAGAHAYRSFVHATCYFTPPSTAMQRELEDLRASMARVTSERAAQAVTQATLAAEVVELRKALLDSAIEMSRLRVAGERQASEIARLSARLDGAP